MSAAASWCLMIAYLSARGAGERFRHSQWRIFFALLEPMALVTIVSLAQVYLMHSPPAFGTSNLLFNATGFIPYYLFLHVSQKIRSMDAMRTIPHTTWIDHALAYVLGEIFVKGYILGIIFVILYFAGTPDAFPRNPLLCILALCLLAGLGFAVGLINLVIMSFWEAWYYVYLLFSRVLMMFSGVLFVVDVAPYSMREFCSYNPLAQSITWFRYNVYSNFPARTLDVTYVLIFGAVLLMVALILEENTREWRKFR